MTATNPTSARIETNRFIMSNTVSAGCLSVLEYVKSIQNTEMFKHLYRTRRSAVRGNGRLSLLPRA